MLRSILWNLGSKAVNLFLPVLVLKHVTSVVDPDSLGIAFYHESLANYLAVIFLLGVPSYGIRQINKDRESTESELFTLILCSSCVLLIFGAIYFAFFEFDVWKIGTIILVLSNILNFEWAVQAHNGFNFLFGRNLILKIFILMSVLVVVRKAEDGYVYFLITTVSFVLTAAANLRFLRKSGFNFTISDLTRSFQHLKSLKVFFYITVLASVYTMLDLPLLRLLDTEMSLIANYGLALKLQKIAVGLVASILVVIYSFGVSSQSKIEVFKQGLGIVFYVAFFIISTVYLFGKEIVLLLAGSKYVESAPYLYILILLTLITGIASLINQNSLLGEDKEKHVLRTIFYAVIMFLFIYFPLCWYFGPWGAACAVLITESFVLARALVDIRRTPYAMILSEFVQNTAVLYLLMGGIVGVIALLTHSIMVKSLVLVLLLVFSFKRFRVYV